MLIVGPRQETVCLWLECQVSGRVGLRFVVKSHETKPPKRHSCGAYLYTRLDGITLQHIWAIAHLATTKAFKSIQKHSKAFKIFKFSALL